MASSMAHQSDNTTNTHSNTPPRTLPPLQSISSTSTAPSSLTLPSLFAHQPAPTAPRYDLAHFASIFATFSQKAAQEIRTEKMELGGNSGRGSYPGYGQQLDVPMYPSHYMPPDTSGRSGQFASGHPYGGPAANPGLPPFPGGSNSFQHGPYPSVPTADLAALQMMWMQANRGHAPPGGEAISQSGYQLSSQPGSQWPGSSIPGHIPSAGAMGAPWLPPNAGPSASPFPAQPGGPQVHPGFGQGMSEQQARQLLYMQWQQQQMAAGGPSTAYGQSTSSPPGDRSSGSDTHGGDDGQEGADDKRRRNTEASARFRAKKKERVHALSQKITDLESKANDLEREATDLKTENTWLKELVIMKGRRRLEVQGAAAAGSGAHAADSDSERE